MTEKRKRKAFLNDFSAALGISDLTDRRRNDAALVFIAFGEEKCRDWLAQASGDHVVWEKLANIREARKLASRKSKENGMSRRTKYNAFFEPKAAKPTKKRRGSIAETDESRKRLYASKSKWERSRESIRTGLRAQIAILKDEDAAPRI